MIIPCYSTTLQFTGTVSSSRLWASQLHLRRALPTSGMKHNTSLVLFILTFALCRFFFPHRGSFRTWFQGQPFSGFRNFDPPLANDVVIHE